MQLGKESVIIINFFLFSCLVEDKVGTKKNIFTLCDKHEWDLKMMLHLFIYIYIFLDLEIFKKS